MTVPDEDQLRVSRVAREREDLGRGFEAFLTVCGTGDRVAPRGERMRVGTGVADAARQLERVGGECTAPLGFVEERQRDRQPRADEAIQCARLVAERSRRLLE